MADNYQQDIQNYDNLVIPNKVEYEDNYSIKTNFLTLFKYLNMLSIRKKTYLVAIVPNDFSFFQKSLFKKNKIRSRYWICPTEHISYFSLRFLSNFISQKLFTKKMEN